MSYAKKVSEWTKWVKSYADNCIHPGVVAGWCMHREEVRGWDDFWHRKECFPPSSNYQDDVYHGAFDAYIKGFQGACDAMYGVEGFPPPKQNF